MYNIVEHNGKYAVEEDGIIMFVGSKRECKGYISRMQKSSGALEELVSDGMW